MYFASGDFGDEGPLTGGAVVSTDFPASLDVVTGVGGTSLALDASNHVVWQLGWETGMSFPNDGFTGWQPAPPGDFIYGSGGGTSAHFAQPKWQHGVVPDAIATINGGAPMRAVPDVAMVGDPTTGMLIGQTDPSTGVYSEYGVGGTSLSTPLFSASVILGQHSCGHALGFANPLFYKQRATAFRDVRPSAIPQALAYIGRSCSRDRLRRALDPHRGWLGHRDRIGYPHWSGVLERASLALVVIDGQSGGAESPGAGPDHSLDCVRSIMMLAKT